MLERGSCPLNRMRIPPETVPMMYFEDFRVGDRYRLPPRSLSEAEIIAYGRKYDPQPFHIDPVAAQATMFGGLVASGWHACAFIMRSIVDWFRTHDVQAVGSPGVDSCRWLKPLRAGDGLRCDAEVVAIRPSRSKPIGIVTMRTELIDAEGQLLTELVGMNMIRCRPPA